MQGAQLDLWTKQLVGASIAALPGFSGAGGEADLPVGELAQRVRQVLAEERRKGFDSAGEIAALGEELAMAVYLTLASSGAAVEVSPRLLLDLNLGLTRAVERLCTAGASSNPSEEVPS